MRSFLAVLAGLILLTLTLGCQSWSKPKTSLSELMSTDSWAANQAIMRAAENAGNYEVGLNAGQKELDARPDNKEARIAMARMQTMAGLSEQALFTLETLKEEHSNAAKIEFARAYLRDGQTKEARPILEKLTKEAQDPQEQRTSRKLLGICEDLEGQHQKAQAIFRQLLVERDEPTVRYNLGSSLLASANFDEAISILKPLVDSPKFLEARVMTAAALSRKNDKKSARGLLEGYMSDREIKRLLGEKL
jgi:Flp pilus assembly protein TadD